MEKLHNTVVTHDTAEDGLQAVKYVTASSPHLILMDKDMPVMDGLEATRRIRELEAAEGRPRAYICFVSASAFPEDNKAAMKAGCDEILPKPVFLPALMNLLLNLPVQLAPPLSAVQETLHSADVSEVDVSMPLLA